MLVAIRIFITGVVMGVADLVPGVSGGTIAFLSGFYDRFINALAQVGPAFLSFVRKPSIEQFKRAWQRVDAKFLLLLLSGILFSLMTMPNVIQYMLNEQPGLIWSFFFGLVVATVIVIGAPLPKSAITIVAFIIGVIIGLAIALALPSQRESMGYPLLFLAGAIAICAMILPGISGSYLLLLLGFYTPVIAILHDRDWVGMGVIALGCLSGLMIFSSFLRWLLSQHRTITLAILLGIMAGGLVKIWPYNASDNIAATPIMMIGCAILGAMMVLIIERLGRENHG